MIRDPSDGSVREVQQTDQELAIPDPLISKIEAALLAGKVKPERVSEHWAYQRAWNDGIDFSLRQVRRVFDKRQ